MPVRLQLEGVDLESLLNQVKDEYGSEATIVEAEKVRRGGVAGFFAKEHFAMTIELDADAAPVAGASSAAATSAAARPAAPPAPGPARRSGEPVRASASGLLALAEAASQREVSTTGSSFAEVLSRLEKVPGNERTLTAPAPVEGAPADEPVFVPRPAESLRRVPAAGAPAPRPTDVQVYAAQTRPPAPLALLGLPAELVPAGDTDLHAALVRGLSALPTAPEPDLSPGAVITVVGALHEALEAARMLCAQWHLGETALHLVGVDGAAGPVPARLVIPTAEDLERRRALAAKGGRPLVVVVDERVAAPGAAGDRPWPALTSARGLPGTRYGVVRATTKPADVRRWAHRVGGVDALLVTEVDSTGDPATILAAGIPVARLGDRLANGTCWASLLCERLADDERRTLPSERLDR